MLSLSIPSAPFSPSVLCLGVAEFGSSIGRDESFALLDAFVAAGGNWADTAHIYASWLPEGAGQSERTLGQWLRSRRPSNFFVGTKGGHPDLATMDISRLSPADIARDVEESLDRLQLSSVDLYYLHRDDPTIPVAEIIDALNKPLRAGLVRALGASNWSVSRIREANAEAERRGLSGFCISQIGWSLAQVNDAVRGAAGMVQMDDETLQWHRATDFPVAAYSSQANGFFAHPLPVAGEAPTPKQQSLAHSYLNPRNRERHARAQQLARQMNRTPHEVAVSYVWSQSFPAIAVIGSRRIKQLNDSLRAADLRLTPAQVKWLEEGGELATDH